jgi:hypothetical protein
VGRIGRPTEIASIVSAYANELLIDGLTTQHSHWEMYPEYEHIHILANQQRSLEPSTLLRLKRRNKAGFNSHPKAYMMPVTHIIAPRVSAVATSPWYIGTTIARMPEPSPATARPIANIEIATEPAFNAPPMMRIVQPSCMVALRPNLSAAQALTMHPRKACVNFQWVPWMFVRTRTHASDIRAIERSKDVTGTSIVWIARDWEVEVFVDCTLSTSATLFLVMAVMTYNSVAQQ